ncbi:MAG: stage II sporulation protein D [Clostridia bacterium]|nr:stage II sporulation protein D [Clostridia bacterium]
MKKIAIYLICFVLICFVLPAICTKTKETSSDSEQLPTNEDTNANQNIGNENTTPKYDYKNYATIKLLHTETGDIEEINIDEYLYGVVSAEMPASYEIEALKAQAVVARTYLIYQIINSSDKHENAHICDSYACCQAWISKEERFERWEEADRESNWQKIVTAVNDTAGKIVTYSGNPINAFFHSNSGGTTESSVNIWGGIDYPYLKSVTTSGEDGYEQYSSDVTMSNEELINKLKVKYSNIEIDFSNDESIKIIEHTESGRVRTIRLGNVEIAGTEARTLLGLKSTNFEVSKSDGNITFSVLGYGHGVGMSQTGADSMAKSGSNFEDIIKHFYTGVEITNIN